VPTDVAAGAAGAVMATSGSTISPSSPRSSRTGSRAFSAGPSVIEGFLAQTGSPANPNRRRPQPFNLCDQVPRDWLLGEEGVDEGGPVLDALEPVLDDGGKLVHVGGGEVTQTVSCWPRRPRRD
jgi:hypothetical protein